MKLLARTLSILCVLRALCGSIQAGKPNILFIAIDDLNNFALGKHPQAKTPNIDRLAKRGVLFTNAHCVVPACNPSRTALLTGISPHVSGVYYNRQDWRKCTNLKNAVTLPEFFKKQGYKTMGGGKIYHAHSLNRQAYEGFLDPKPWHAYFPSKNQQMPIEIDPDPMPENGNPKHYGGHMDWSILDISDNEMADGQVVSWAEKQLAQKHDKPLFLAVGIYRPHVPWYTPKRWFDQFPPDDVQLPETKQGDLDDVPPVGRGFARRTWQQWMVDNKKWHGFVRGYLASISFADAMVGRLLDALDKGPHAKNTIIVLWGDHGYHLGHKEHWEKFALWEQATQVPVIFSAPGLSKGKKTNRPASLLDVYPTLVELCGDRPSKQLNGKSLVPWLRDPGAEFKTPVITTHGRGNHAVRSAHWRYIRYYDGSEELYDHRKDPHEFTNLASQVPYADVKARHAKWLPKEESGYDPLEGVPTKWRR
ncbi:MAG: iduronate-2-sulfatase [Verrucomicrobiales bacterium]|nr:iduronate-2-sulfatase [Verrucomicrobiales bacterium]